MGAPDGILVAGPAPDRTRRPRLPYMPGVDALRTLAVMAVFLYHADDGLVPGGFLGVDLFFVISGYLITSLLISELGMEGRVDVLRFWVRRALRLLPAAGVMVAGTMLAALVLAPDEVGRLRDDAASSLLYFNNWHQVASGQSYFESFERPSLFRHLWSLSIEEQFYLLWPVVFAATMTLFGRRRVLLGVVVAALASTGLMALLFSGGDPSRVYYGTDTRMVTLLAGVVLAFVWHPDSLGRPSGRFAAPAMDAIGGVALAMVAFSFLQADERGSSLYHGGLLLFAFWGALLVGAMAHPAASLGRRIAAGPVLWLGVRSYSFYLWHWPVLALSRPNEDVSFGGPGLLVLQFERVDDASGFDHSREPSRTSAAGADTLSGA